MSPLPLDWRACIWGNKDYPKYLLYHRLQAQQLEDYKAKLDRPGLFQVAPSILTLLPVLDLELSATSREWQHTGIKNEDDMKNWLNAKAPFQPDPDCRFVCMLAGSSRDSFRMTASMFRRLASFHQVMPEFIEFISVFGKRQFATGDRFCDFKSRIHLDTPPPKHYIRPELGRTGMQYQICYNLRVVGQDRVNKTWNIRQAVFHHQFDVKSRTSLWITAKGNRDIQTLIEEEVKDVQPKDHVIESDRFEFTLKIHGAFAKWSTKGWLNYIESIEDAQDRSLTALQPKLGWRANNLTKELDPADLQTVQKREQKTQKILSTLEANNYILNSLTTFYKDLLETNPDLFAGNQYLPRVDKFSKLLKSIQSETNSLILRTQHLIQAIADHKSLIIKQLEFQSNEKMEDLTMETYDLGVQTHHLGVLAQNEAVAVRVVTFLALVYLPSTVVSSFFSTDIIKYQNTGSAGRSYSSLAMNTWLAVTLPFTVLTLLVGWLGLKFEAGRQEKEMQKAKEAKIAEKETGRLPGSERLFRFPTTLEPS